MPAAACVHFWPTVTCDGPYGPAEGAGGAASEDPTCPVTRAGPPASGVPRGEQSKSVRGEAGGGGPTGC